MSHEPRPEATLNGAAVAAVLAAAIGAFAMGLIAFLAAADLVSIPAVYRPAGGVSGRTTLATVIWLIAWAWLHRRWRARDIPSRGVHRAAVVLILLGLLLSMPPVWELV